MPTDLPMTEPTPVEPRRHVVLSVILLLATCLSTLWLGAVDWNPTGRLQLFVSNAAANWSQGVPMADLKEALAVTSEAGGPIHWRQGFLYAGVVMGLLLAHELGHFLMALRQRVPASLPFFIPMPVIPFGTLGAVIVMDGSESNRRQTFDLGIAGPLLGLAATLPVLWLGILQLPAAPPYAHGFCFHNPLLLKYMIAWLHPGYATPDVLYLSQFNPFLMAGWVGLLVTGLNMLPVSQLDGGHVVYALLGERARLLARALIVGAILYIIVTERYFWVVMLVLVILLGADHPPTVDDRCRLGWFRQLLGWASLLIPVVCFPAGGITPFAK
jgi:Zn-dependent protease